MSQSPSGVRRAGLRVSTGLLVIVGALLPSALAGGRAAAVAWSPFCQDANDVLGTAINTIPAKLPSASAVYQEVLLLKTLVGTLPALIIQSPASIKSKFSSAETSFRTALGSENRVEAKASAAAADQSATSTHYREGVAQLRAAAALPYRTCSDLPLVVASEITETASYDAVKAAGVEHRTVTTADLRSEASKFTGLSLVGSLNNVTHSAKFLVVLAAGVRGAYCVREPSIVNGSPGPASAC